MGRLLYFGRAEKIPGRGLTVLAGCVTVVTAMTIKLPTPERVQAGWRIRRDLKRWVDIEAAKRQIVPARVIEELILGMRDCTENLQDLTDAK